MRASVCFYRATLYVRVPDVARCPSVRLSVCLSDTFMYCIQTAEDLVKLLSRPDNPIILVFWLRTPIPNFKRNAFSRSAKYTARWENSVSHPKGAGFQRSPILGIPYTFCRRTTKFDVVPFHLCVHRLSQNYRIGHCNTYEEACFRKSAMPPRQGAGLSAPLFWGSFL